MRGDLGLSLTLRLHSDYKSPGAFGQHLRGMMQGSAVRSCLDLEVGARTPHEHVFRATSTLCKPSPRSPCTHAANLFVMLLPF